jgi:large subunit ribosomal protein L25
METLELSCEKREAGRTARARAVRRAGRVPAVLYGPTREPIAVAVGAADLIGSMAGTSRQRLIRLKSSTPELDNRHIVFKEIQRAPVSGQIVHVDFYEVDLSRPLRISIPLHFVGRAAGVADGGILQPLVREVEVECPPLEIPENIEIDVSALGIHDVIHISHVQFAPNVKPIYDSDYAVVSVLPPTVAEAPVAAAAPVEGAAEAGAAEGGAAATTEGAAKAAEG